MTVVSLSDAERERNLREAMADSMEVPRSDTAIADLAHDLIYMARNKRWATMQLNFENGRLVGVRGTSHNRGSIGRTPH